jgi:hypothetical protein
MDHGTCQRCGRQALFGAGNHLKLVILPECISTGKSFVLLFLVNRGIAEVLGHDLEELSSGM